MRVLAQDARDHADAEHDQRESDQPLGPVVETLGQAHVQLKHGNAERGHREGVAERIGHA